MSRHAPGSAAQAKRSLSVLRGRADRWSDLVSRGVRQAREDLDAAMDRDPATDNRWEMALASPGLHAVWAHRAAHALWQRGDSTRIPARMVSYFSRMVTGIEIHPNATVGRRVFIDHGMGVVVGATAEIGDDVLMYHDVLLGGRSLETVKRHPTIGDGVTLGSGARVLGPVVVGARSQVGANAVVVKDVPADSVAVGIPATVRPHKSHSPGERHVDPALWI